MAHATKDAIRLAAESDLLTFIQLVAPHRVLGQVHKDLCRWWTRDERLKHQMCLLPRDHQKSAMIAYRVAWEITRNPAVTVLYISSTSNLAQKQLGFIKDILQSPVYRRYWPEMIHEDEGKRKKWTESEIAVDHPKRVAEGVRDPTVFTAGLTTGITGMHCNVAVLDDVVVKENAYTAEGRRKVSHQYSLLSSIETSDAEEWVVGTRYHPKDLYGTLVELEEERYNADGEIIERVPVYEVFQREVEDLGDGTGTFLWPRQQRGDGRWFGFDAGILATKRAKYLDKTQFYAQYYNNPNDPQEAALNPDLFQYYNRAMLKRRDGVWTYNGKPLAVFAAIDFAFSLREKSDFTAIAVIGVDSDGNIYVLDLARVKTNKNEGYYKLVYDAHMKWGFRKMRAECTVAQEVIANTLTEYIKQDGLRLSIDKHKPTRHQGTKEERIHNILSHRYENMAIWHFEGGMNEDLEQELIMQKPPNDDLKDALANAIDIMKIPQAQRSRRKDTGLVVHGRFGGISA